MANLSIRNLDDHIYSLLGTTAKSQGISMEEEVRRILTSHFNSTESIAEGFIRYFGEKNGVDLKLRKRKPHEPMMFSE